MPAISDTVEYVSMSGTRYDATVTHMRPSGRLDLAVHIGARNPVPLANIEWIEKRSFATRGTAGPAA